VEYQNSIQTSKWTRASAKSNHSWAKRKYVRDACATTNILPFAFDGVTNLNGHIPTLPKEGENVRDRKISRRTCVFSLSSSLPSLSHLEMYPILRASVSIRAANIDIEDDEENLAKRSPRTTRSIRFCGWLCADENSHECNQIHVNSIFVHLSPQNLSKARFTSRQI